MWFDHLLALSTLPLILFNHKRFSQGRQNFRFNNKTAAQTAIPSSQHPRLKFLTSKINPHRSINFSTFNMRPNSNYTPSTSNNCSSSSNSYFSKSILNNSFNTSSSNRPSTLGPSSRSLFLGQPILAAQ